MVSPQNDPVLPLAVDVLVAAADGDPTTVARAIRLAEAALRAEVAGGERMDESG